MAIAPSKPCCTTTAHKLAEPSADEAIADTSHNDPCSDWQLLSAAGAPQAKGLDAEPKLLTVVLAYPPLKLLVGASSLSPGQGHIGPSQHRSAVRSESAPFCCPSDLTPESLVMPVPKARKGRSHRIGAGFGGRQHASKVWPQAQYHRASICIGARRLQRVSGDAITNAVGGAGGLELGSPATGAALGTRISSGAGSDRPTRLRLLAHPWAGGRARHHLQPWHQGSLS